MPFNSPSGLRAPRLRLKDVTAKNAHKHAGKLTDQRCDQCDAPMRVTQGAKVTFLGCSKYPTCSSPPVYPWKPYGLNKWGGQQEEVVFYVDEFGEPTDGP